MKKFNNKKSVIEQGGLMIEALAMLGLIAVVTPTMYKKSAERTMEVEDINTASAIRTYMNGVESLLAANYSELMEKIPEPAGDNPTIVSLDDLELTVPGSDEAGSDTVKAMDELEKYLPYGYSAKDNLYNYGQPSFAVARSGNNLSAFMVFPARGGDEEETIGQERTVRIASLIGSNGGYVREGEARGVGGTWNLTSDELSSIAGSTPGNYSIVTSSIDVVNGAEGMGGDMTKYLQRTAENGEIEKWRNTMRTDIYMGELTNKGHDYDDKTTDGYFSIRNINQLIVGADGSDADNDKGWEKASDRDSLYVNEKYQTSNGEGAEGEEGDSDVKRGLESYGLYIADATDDTRGKYGINAYIAGSLEAAGKRLFTDENELTYHGPKIQLGGIDEDETTGTATKYLITAVTEKLESEEEVPEGTEAPEGRNRVEIMPVSKGDSGDAPLIIASDSDLNEVEVGNIGTETGTKLLLAKAGDKTIDGTGAEEDDGYNTTEDASNAPKISYDTGQSVPQFPVVVDSNMAVNGVLTAGQLDTQKIRVAELAVGSPNINDSLKWMEVDEDGVHIHSRDGSVATDDGEGHTTAATAKMQVEVNDNIIAMRAGSAAQEANTEDNEPTAHESQFIMDDSGVKIIAQGEGGNAATGHSIELTTGTKGVRERLEKNEITIGSPESTEEDETGEGEGNSSYRVKYEEGGYVDMIGTTLQVTDSAANPVFTIRGNDTEESGLVGGNYNDPTTYKTSNTDTNGKFKIAGHGDTVFTSDAVSHNNENKAVKFLAMGVKSSGEDKGIDDQYNAGVNIVSDSDTAGNNSKRVVYIDLENGSSHAYVGAPKGWENTSGSDNSFDSFELDNKTGGKRTMAQGTVYIRKGLIDIAPNRSDYTGGEEPKGNASADTSSGTVRASRFVANNVNIKGERIMYKNTLNDSDYQSGVSNKYDTYMVNPAYTSVMKDIKLTSRFGARLSDILPDFITKRIYYSTNSYDEGTDYTNLSGDEGDRTPGSEGTSPYASPYLGSIPAPSCPPGYGRAITVVPGSFEMATVGTLEPAGAAGLDVSQAAMLGLKVDATNPGEYEQTDGVVHTNYTSKAEFLENQPVFGRIRDLEQGSIEKGSVPAQLQTTRGSAENDGGKWEPDLVQFYQNSKGPEDDGDEENRLFLIGGVARVGVDRNTLKSDEAVFHENSHVDLRDQTLYIDHFGYNTRSTGADIDAIQDNKGLALKADVVADKYDSSGILTKNQSVSDTDEGAYFLVTNDPNQRPISFQKSTWLKTAFKELETSTGYVNGWAVLTGFIYPVGLYGNVASVLGVTKDDYNDDGDDKIDGYWNLFPVLKNTLTSYSTTYCFIDNKNDSVTGVTWNADTENAGNIQYNIDDWNEDYSAPYAAERKVLNDPALKYDELW